LKERRDEESLALARRLDRETGALAALGAGQADLLVGAERAAALTPVLRVAGVLDGELEAMLDAAARSLRAAISAETAEAHSARIAALDRRLDGD
jgi:hypothetical protein